MCKKVSTDSHRHVSFNRTDKYRSLRSSSLLGYTEADIFSNKLIYQISYDKPTMNYTFLFSFLYFEIPVNRICITVFWLPDIDCTIGCLQGPCVRLSGIPAVDWAVVRLLVSGACGNRCQLSCAVLYTLHRGRLCSSHQLYLHLWCIQENAEACTPLPHWHQLPMGHGHTVWLPVHSPWGYDTLSV